MTYHFIDSVCKRFPEPERVNPVITAPDGSGLAEAKAIAEHFGIADINLVKPSIGEATRVLLRRKPETVLVHSLNDEKYLGHLYRLAEEKGVPVQEYPLRNYLACGLIKRMADC